MLSYLIRRLLLVPPTFILITLLVFSISRLVPGGPVERMIQAAALAGEEKGGDTSQKSGSGLGEEQLEAIEEEYGYDKPPLIAYFQWLGVMPKEAQLSKKEFKPSEEEQKVEVILHGSGEKVVVTVVGEEVSSATGMDGQNILENGWAIRVENEATRQQKFMRRKGLAYKGMAPKYDPRVVVYKKQFSGLFQGNLGRSILYGDRVIDLIVERIPIATYFGILITMITYSISIPLGVVKAIRHRTAMDTITSILIFIGYSIPGFALGAVLVIWLGAQLQLFPLFGLTSSNFDSLSAFEKVKDLAHHTVLPLTCYVIGSFAFLTMLMKNNLMDNLAADYVKTAVSRGASFKRAVFGHALKNSLIPIATNLGGLLSIFVMGSLLVEKVFDIQGLGLLSFEAVVSVDIPVIMGALTISSLLMLFGNILSDVIVAAINPRIKFD